MKLKALELTRCTEGNEENETALGCESICGTADRSIQVFGSNFPGVISSSPKYSYLCRSLAFLSKDWEGVLDLRVEAGIILFVPTYRNLRYCEFTKKAVPK